jgi:hypothetical protein
MSGPTQPDSSGRRRSLGVGRSYRASFFDVSLICTYSDEDAFRRSCVYPEHDAVVTHIQSVTRAGGIVDYLA